MEPMTPALETRFVRQPLGPSSKAIMRVRERTGCGSGCLVGVRNGKSLALTNAHVAGTTPGKIVHCDLPGNGLTRVPAKIVMAGYSNRIMMDWAVIELDRLIADLPHVKLRNTVPQGRHYTGGYPRCDGPYYQEIQTVRISHSGTVWHWQPNSIGGQSGSAIHSFDDNLQTGLLTWSWGGNGAGQTCRSIWNQYVNRTAVGIPRPEGLIELSENRAEDLEEGFHCETSITNLPIWAHLDDDDDDDTPVNPGSPAFVAATLKRARAIKAEAEALIELARKYSSSGQGIDPEHNDGSDTDPDNFGL